MKLLKRILKSEAGQALPMALILLVLGGLLVVPTLAFMTTNLNANRLIEEKTEGIYAADAGIQDALWKLGNDIDPFPEGITSYDLAETINGMTVTVEKQALTTEPDGDLYTLKSTARLNGQVKAVIVAQAWIGLNFSWFFDSAITSADDVTIRSGSVVTGEVTYAGDLDNKGTITCPDPPCENNQPDLPEDWPTDQELSRFYIDDVDVNNSYGSTWTIPNSPLSGSRGSETNPDVIEWPAGSGALYRYGNLNIIGGRDAWAKLGGTVYITGNLDINTNQNCTLDLNGQTIYVQGTITVWPNITLIGSGCIIGVGFVDFQPNAAGGSSDDFIFVMSVATGTKIQPGGTFYGSTAGYTQDVTLQPGTTLSRLRAPAEGELNFPGGDGGSGGGGGGSSSPPLRNYNIQ